MNMKKFLMVLALGTLFAHASSAQEIGLRFGEVIGDNNVSIDGTLPFGESRLHMDVSFDEAFGADIFWDFFNRPLGDVQGLTWYVGAGGSLVMDNNIFLLGGAGEIGIEYHFDFPMAAGLDYRPTYWLIDEDTNLGFEGYWGLNVRYVIGK